MIACSKIDTQWLITRTNRFVSIFEYDHDFPRYARNENRAHFVHPIDGSNFMQGVAPPTGTGNSLPPSTVKS